MSPRNSARGVGWWLVAAAALSLAVSLVDYFLPENGIDGSLGVLIVVGSTLLMLLASAAVALGYVHGALRGLLVVLILLDILGSGFASYMLEADALMALFAFALVAWLFVVTSRQRVVHGTEAAR